MALNLREVIFQSDWPFLQTLFADDIVQLEKERGK
jgi:hypothetical protein